MRNVAENQPGAQGYGSCENKLPYGYLKRSISLQYLNLREANSQTVEALLLAKHHREPRLTTKVLNSNNKKDLYEILFM